MKFLKNKWFLFIAGLLLGALVLLAIRFATYNPVRVHYHANFAVYLNGQREQFKGTQYYEEEGTMCSKQEIVTPMSRSHMHDNVNNVVHVEDQAVTWGNFFQSLGWNIGPDFIETPNGQMYTDSGNAVLHIIVDGQDYTGLGGIDNMVIKDQSRVLVSYGDISDEQLQQEYKSVPSTAKHYDETRDPAGCAGSEKTTVSDRLHHLF